MKKTFFATTLTVFFSVNVQANFAVSQQANNKVGLYLGGQIWQSEASGVFGEKNTVNDFNLKKERQGNYFVAIEHPFPVLPNLRISSISLDNTGITHSIKEYNADNEIAHVDVYAELDVDAIFNVSYVDYTLYYQLLENRLFSFDLGLTGRDFSGAVTVTESANITTTSRDYIWDGAEHDDHDYHTVVESTNTVITNKINANEIEPMLYVASNISLPLRDVSVFVQGNFSLVNDHSLYDYQVGLSYDLIHSSVGNFNLTLGYRTVKMEFENLDNLYTDSDFKGVFSGLIAHF